MPPASSWSLSTPPGLSGREKDLPVPRAVSPCCRSPVRVVTRVCPAWGHLAALPPRREGSAGVQVGGRVGAGCLHGQIPAATAGCVSSRVILLADVLFTFSFLQQLSVLVPGFVLGGGRICGYKTCTEASFRSERGSLCTGRCFALCSKFPFESAKLS